MGNFAQGNLRGGSWNDDLLQARTANPSLLNQMLPPKRRRPPASAGELSMLRYLSPTLLICAGFSMAAAEAETPPAAETAAEETTAEAPQPAEAEEPAAEEAATVATPNNEEAAPTETTTETHPSTSQRSW